MALFVNGSIALLYGEDSYQQKIAFTFLQVIHDQKYNNVKAMDGQAVRK